MDLSIFVGKVNSLKREISFTRAVNLLIYLFLRKNGYEYNNYKSLFFFFCLIFIKKITNTSFMPVQLTKSFTIG